jgi:Zn finger protein HypA/HybF involved in hydrogenase expression
MFMRRPYAQYREDEKGRLQEAFQASNPPYFDKLQGRTADHDRIKAIIEHTKEEQAILEENFKDERQARIQAVAVEVGQERLDKLEYLPPHVRTQMLAKNSILQEARKRVDEAHDRDLQALKAEGTRAIEQIADGQHLRGQSFSKEEIEKMTTQERDTHFKAEAHKVFDDCREARFQVSKTMNTERDRMIEEAKENGSDNPMEDVKSFQARMYKDVDEKLHKDFHALCLKYGYDPEHQQVQFDLNKNDQATGQNQEADEHHIAPEQTLDDGEEDQTPPATQKPDDQDQSQ